MEITIALKNYKKEIWILCKLDFVINIELKLIHEYI